MIGWCVFLERVIIESPNPKRKLNMYTSANKKTCFMMAAAFATHTQHPFFFLFLLCLFLFSIHGVLYSLRCATLRSAAASSSNTLNRCVNTRLSKQLGTEPRAPAASMCVQRRSINYVHSGESLYRVQQTRERERKRPRCKPPIQV